MSGREMLPMTQCINILLGEIGIDVEETTSIKEKLKIACSEVGVDFEEESKSENGGLKNAILICARNLEIQHKIFKRAREEQTTPGEHTRRRPRNDDVGDVGEDLIKALTPLSLRDYNGDDEDDEDDEDDDFDPLEDGAYFDDSSECSSDTYVDENNDDDLEVHESIAAEELNSSGMLRDLGHSLQQPEEQFQPKRKRNSIEWTFMQEIDAESFAIHTRKVEDKYSSGKMPEELEQIFDSYSKNGSRWNLAQQPYHTQGGKIITAIYGCEFRRSRKGYEGSPCNAKIKVNYCQESNRLQIFRSGTHNHVGARSLNLDDSHGVPHVLRGEILKEFISQPKARSTSIRQHLRNKNLLGPDDYKLTSKRRRQLMRFLRSERLKLVQTSMRNDVGAMASWVGDMLDGRDESKLIELAQNVNAESKHKLVVLYYEQVVEPTPKLILVVTTLNLLANVGRQHSLDLGTLLCTDGTRRITVEGFPLIVTGNHDLRQHFHLLSITVAWTENMDIYSVVLQTTWRAGVVVSREFGLLRVDLSFPTYVMSDNADEIQGAVQNAWYLTRLLNCHFHHMKSVKKKKLLFPNSPYDSSYKCAKQQIYLMHKLTIKTNGLDRLIISKFVLNWRSRCPEFIEKWAPEYGGGDEANFRRKAGWQSSRPDKPGICSTNNGLESMNNVLKNEGSQRAVLGVVPAFKAIGAWLEQKSENDAVFESSPEISRTDWEEAQVFLRSGALGFDLTSSASGKIDFHMLREFEKDDAKHFAILSSQSLATMKDEGSIDIERARAQEILDKYVDLVMHGGASTFITPLRS
uniref:MULE transposase domain-containing protein n=1 Tax=Aureoumbra lagunensis TaxID=44058 RepID=A0A7S3NNP5_9STRA